MVSWVEDAAPPNLGEGPLIFVDVPGLSAVRHGNPGGRPDSPKLVERVGDQHHIVLEPHGVRHHTGGLYNHIAGTVAQFASPRP